MGKWAGGVWNMVFVGDTNVPESHCGLDDTPPATTIEKTPIIVEKPYVVSDGNNGYSLMVPRLEIDKVGATPGFENADEVPFDQVYVASDSDSAETINAKLDEGLHLILQPGQYNLKDSIKVTKENTVVLGMGLATLISTSGKPCIEVDNVDGVRIAGILLQAGETDSDSLLKWGMSGGFNGSDSNPGVMQDVFARVGGTNQKDVPVIVDKMVQINSGNIIVDDTWMWRADHGIDGSIDDPTNNAVSTGL